MYKGQMMLKHIRSIFNVLHCILIIIASLLVLSCKDKIVDPPQEKQLYSPMLRGKVIIENQTEYSNALIYIDSLNRGVSTDSSGNFTIYFSEKDSVYSEVFKVVYFLNDYDIPDEKFDNKFSLRYSAKIMLVKGKLKLDTLDVDSEGNIKTKVMKQIVRVEGWTDKYEYRVGDTITFTARVTNLSDRTIHIVTTICGGSLGCNDFLYNDKYIAFRLNGYLPPFNAECNIDVQSGQYYEGTVSDLIFGSQSLIPDEYIVATPFQIEGRTLNHLESKFYKYIVEEWDKIHRGASPKLDLFPNKYKFPHIKIIK
ncbi:MAG: hypothetical protein A2254_15120 [Ignavibacteria bacterium RIFOXYA2_FULL_35_9]|nr:MAG: hypothetical protein A2254_15120 [Ignavibacteria bacterium RIFOXYA2_FULL_35_9]